MSGVESLQKSGLFTEKAQPKKCCCVHPAHGGGECGRPVKEGSNWCEGCLNDFLNELKYPKEDLDDYGL